MREVIQAIDRFHLLELIDRHIQTEGPHCDLNHIDVSEVISLHRLFDKFPQFIIRRSVFIASLWRHLQVEYVQRIVVGMDLF